MGAQCGNCRWCVSACVFVCVRVCIYASGTSVSAVFARLMGGLSFVCLEFVVANGRALTVCWLILL
jgi:hypothetical protein